MDTRGSTSSGWRLGGGVGPVVRGDNPQTAQIVVDFYIHKIDYYQRNGKPISYASDSVSAVVTAISSSWIWVWRRKLTLHQDWRSTTRKLEREGDRTKICSKCAWSIISSGAILYLLLQFIHSFIHSLEISIKIFNLDELASNEALIQKKIYYLK